MNIEINAASQEEYDRAYSLTRELMKYHNALDIFTMTPERFKKLLDTKSLACLIAYVGGESAGVMNFFYKYTTFTGRKILYIEDLYVCPQFRGYGLGHKMFDAARQIASDNDCEQIELKCAVWNENSKKFYKSCGMETDKDWETFILNKSLF